MSKETRVGLGGLRWLRLNLEGLAPVAVAALVTAVGLTAGPGAVSAAAQPAGADGAFTADQAASGWRPTAFSAASATASASRA